MGRNGWLDGGEVTIRKKSGQRYVGTPTIGISGGLMLFGNSAAVDAAQCRNALKVQYADACGRSRSRSKRAGGAVTTGVPRRFIGEEIAQPAFLTQNLHQPFGLISPSTSVQAFGSWNSEQLLHS